MFDRMLRRIWVYHHCGEAVLVLAAALVPVSADSRIAFGSAVTAGFPASRFPLPGAVKQVRERNADQGFLSKPTTRRPYR